LELVLGDAGWNPCRPSEEPPTTIAGKNPCPNLTTLKTIKTK